MMTWPDELNGLPERGSWQYRPSPDNARTDFDQGPARVRRRFTTMLAELDFAVVMDYTEFERFKGWVAYDLYGGVAWFSMSVFVGGEYVTRTVRFRDAKNPYEGSDDGFGRTKVSMKLEIRDGGLTLDGGGAWAIGEYGFSGLDGVADSLQIAVNVDYPAAST